MVAHTSQRTTNPAYSLTPTADISPGYHSTSYYHIIILSYSIFCFVFRQFDVARQHLFFTFTQPSFNEKGDTIEILLLLESWLLKAVS